MSKKLFYGVLGLIAGSIAGFIFANSLNRDAISERQATNVPALRTMSDGPSAKDAPGSMLAGVSETIARADAEPDNFVAQMKAGDLFARIGRFDKAVEYYKKGIELRPADVRGYVVLANALFDSRRFEEAAEYYSKAIELDPKDVNVRTDLGATFVERSKPDYERALIEFDRALAIEPRHEPTLDYLGITHFRRGDIDAATAALKQLEEVNPLSVLVGRLRQNMSLQ